MLICVVTSPSAALTSLSSSITRTQISAEPVSRDPRNFRQRARLLEEMRSADSSVPSRTEAADRNVQFALLEPTKLADIGALHGKTRQVGAPGWFRIASEDKAERGTKYLLRTAVALVAALVRSLLLAMFFFQCQPQAALSAGMRPDDFAVRAFKRF